MKRVFSFLLLALLTSCADGKERNYTGSTPAGETVKLFLGIPLADSVDFIRWTVTLQNDQYILQCNYGISKPNTNGFMDGGKKIHLRGRLKKENNYCSLQNGDKTLKVAELNSDLLHLLDREDKFLAGNGGWSYTLCNTVPSTTDKINFISKQTKLKDSMVFEGRTPCGVPGIIAPGKECYKLKWYIVLYSDPQKNEPTTYKVFGTTWRPQGGRKGKWKIATGKDNRIVYELLDENDKTFLYILKPDENILTFTDATGKLLVGDEDFSYTLNRVW